MTDFDIYNQATSTLQQQAAPPTGCRRSMSSRQAAVRACSPEPAVGYGEDIAKGAAGGLGRGVAGTIGMGGTIGNLARAGLEKAGVPDDGIDYAKRVLNRAAPMTRVFSGAGRRRRCRGAIEGVTGKFYEPQTIPGQYASTIAEFAPGALIPGGPLAVSARAIAAKTVNTVAPAITSETAGQLTKDTPYEPYARLAGGARRRVAGPKSSRRSGRLRGLMRVPWRRWRRKAFR